MAVIGIDLGASNSATAALGSKFPVIIHSAEGISIGSKMADTKCRQNTQRQNKSSIQEKK